MGWGHGQGMAGEWIWDGWRFRMLGLWDFGHNLPNWKMLRKWNLHSMIDLNTVKGPLNLCLSRPISVCLMAGLTMARHTV